MKSKPLPTSPGAAAPDSGSQRLGRRRVVVGAGVAAGAALAAAALPRRPGAEPEVAGGAKVEKSAEGYRLTDHIRRYYETTRS